MTEGRGQHLAVINQIPKPFKHTYLFVVAVAALPVKSKLPAHFADYKWGDEELFTIT